MTLPTTNHKQPNKHHGSKSISLHYNVICNEYSVEEFINLCCLLPRKIGNYVCHNQLPHNCSNKSITSSNITCFEYQTIEKSCQES